MTNAIHNRTKTPLPIFFIDLEPSPENKNIFKVKTLYHSRVSIEEPYKRTEIVQCQRCQAYGHTRGYCSHPARCVRCAGSHESVTCSKTRETHATCALCGGQHPANYKGCTVYQDLQRVRRPVRPAPLAQRIAPQRPAATQQPYTPAAFPQLAPAPQPSKLPSGPPPQPRPRLRLQQQPPVVTGGPQVSYSQALSGPRRISRPAPPPPTTAYSMPDLSSQFSSFLHQFTSVANQLILAVSSLVTLLQNVVPK